MAKKFDLDRDGRLNSEERKAAEDALRDGFDKNFLFGLERAGLSKEIREAKNNLKHIRIVQRDGKIVQGEDFTCLAPERPQTVQDTTRPKTRQELIESRKKQNVSELSQAFDLFKEGTKTNDANTPSKSSLTGDRV